MRAPAARSSVHGSGGGAPGGGGRGRRGADAPRPRDPDPVELDDRPVVTLALALDAEEARDMSTLLVDEEEIVRTEGSERQTEQAEHPDRGPGHGQAERARPVALRLTEAGERPHAGG